MSIRSARYNLLSLRNPKGLTFIPEERDAWAFLDAAGITSSRQQRAVIDLVRGLKHAQLWSKMKAIYPFVGGTATTHKFNLKDPRDADAAFRLSFSGGWTHASTGADPNGTNAWANSFINPSNNLSFNSTHLSIYHRENRQAADLYAVSMGASVSTTNDGRLYILPREGQPAGNLSYVTINKGNTTGDDFISFSDTNNAAYYIASRTSINLLKAYRNSINTATGTNSGTKLVNADIAIGAYNVKTTVNQPLYFTTCEIAFATIGDGLSDTDATNLYNIVQRYQTSLGRQV